MSVKFTKEHYLGLHDYKPLSKQQISNFHYHLNDEECNVFDRLRVIRRIGSESFSATIWEVDFFIKQDEKIKMAIKVQTNLDKTLEEININNYLSQFPTYFLQMFGSIYCENIDLIGIININQTFSGYFMFLELAIGDLSQYLINSDVPEDQLIDFINQVFDSIYVLGKSQIFHGDLHLKNVFIVPRMFENRLIEKAVVGDFGESSGIDAITSHTSDLVKFCSSLSPFLKSKFPYKYGYTKSKLDEIVKTINRLTPALENNYDMWNDHNRDEEGNVNFDELDRYFERVVKNTIIKAKSVLN